MCTRRGDVTGAIAVCADRFQGRPKKDLEAALHPLEVLAARFAEGLSGLRPETDAPVHEVGFVVPDAGHRTLSGVPHVRRSAS